MHHPYESFSASVEAFLELAAHDPHVLAIKLTLYRTSGDTAIVRALTEAAEQGKQVAVLIELQARFDEQNNITFARTMESYGIHVAYGLPGLKTHAKTALVVRRDAGRHPALRAHRHRQLQLQDGAPLHRPRVVHVQPGDRRRPDATCSTR